MKYKILSIFLLCNISLFSQEEDCLCGIVSKDPKYAKALYLLSLSVENSWFYIGEGVNYPTVASEFYPPYELREDFDDPYPYEGKIYWEISRTVQRDRELIFTKEESKIHLPNLESNLWVPFEITRRIEWYEDLNSKNPTYHWKENTFLFKKNYGSVPHVFRVLKNDIKKYYESSENFLDARIQDLSNKIPVYERFILVDRLINKKTLTKRKKEIQALYKKKLSFVEQKETAALEACKESLDWCIDNHHSPSAYYNRGLFDYLEGNTIDALDRLTIALKGSDTDLFAKLQEDAILLKGQTELEAGLYADAVLTLTELINKNPEKKEAYFERATGYFELGDFDLSLQDYLQSKVALPVISSTSLDMIPFSKGLTLGIVQGGVQGGTEFIPSLLASLQGLSQGLWAFAQDPVDVSADFVDASKACVNFIREHTPLETLQELVPELQDLIAKWDGLEDQIKGELTGQIIGKCGVDIFAGVGVTKAMNSYRLLKKANNMMTFEAMAISERNRSVIKMEALKRAQNRKEVFKNANLKIQPDKQGKHIIGHNNYEPILNKSIFEHPNPQKLIDEFSGKGVSLRNQTPGTPSYQELVNFEEFIGYAIDRATGEKVATSWGKIHYAQDGVHIVPTIRKGQ
ncbi:MAG: polymorphic toxin type 50 domain-containing protein [Chlamydiae bacterium]|nr:polymorphic toxin type 50 domain-containing protein [Chlamydiota bacterium]